MTATDLMRLVRLPLVVTAVFDPVAGLYLAGGATPSAYLGVATAAALLYLGGMALNDLFDLGVDRQHRPDRVLPAGRVRPGRALLLGTALLMGGVAVAALVRPGCGAAAAAVALMVVLYDGCLKRTALLGSVAMGACRGGSLMIGVFAAPAVAAPPPAAWIVAAALAAYTTAVTAVSRLEEVTGDIPRSAVRLRLLPGILGLGAIPAVVTPYQWAAAAPLVLLAISLLAPDARGGRPLTRGEVMARVGAAVRAVLLVDAAVLWGAGGFALGAAALGLFLVATAVANRRARAG